MDDLRQGWLSPTGEFRECSSYDHVSTAREIAEILHLPDIDVKTGRQISGDDALMKCGWAYVGISSFWRHEWRIGWDRNLTPEQVRFLRPYFEGACLPVNEYSLMRWMDELGG